MRFFCHELHEQKNPANLENLMKIVVQTNRV